MLLRSREREAVSADFQRGECQARQAFGAVTKPDLSAAVAALDQWLEDNLAAMTAMIPEPARSGLSSDQHLEILVQLLEQRTDG